VTPQRTSELVRFSIGALTAVCLIAYFGLAGRAIGTRPGRATRP
jgi:hypothetical protein